MYVTSSLRVGQITFRSSAATCRSEQGGRSPVPLSGSPGPAPALRALASRLGRHVLTYAALNGSTTHGPAGPCGPANPHLQGRRDSNPQPPVLETGTLPIELLPYGCNPQSVCRTHPLRRTKTRPAGRNQLVVRQRPEVTPWKHANHENIGPRVRHLRIRDPGRRRESQGAEGGRPAGHRVRRRRARLPDS